MNKIEYGTEFLDQLKDSVHDLYDRNQELLSSNVKLREEKIKLKGIINKTIEYIYLHSTQRKWFADISDRLHNQEIQFKGRIQDLLDILKGVDKE